MSVTDKGMEWVGGIFRHKRHQTVGIALIVLVLGGLFAGYAVRSTGRKMRDELLQQARLVAQPVLDGGALIGYLELGKEIEGTLTAIHDEHRVELAATVRKNVLTREKWESGMKLLGREADWDRFTDDVIIYSSLPRFPDECEPFIHAEKVHEYGDIGEVKFDAKSWSVMVSPLTDASGAHIGDLLIICDISAAKAGFSQLIAGAREVSLVLLIALLSFLYVGLRRTDQGIRLQQAELAESKELLVSTLRSIGDGVITTDNLGRVANLNAVAETLTGWRVDDALGRPVTEVFRIINAKTRETADVPVERAIKEGLIVELANDTVLIGRDGKEHQVADSCAPIRDGAGHIVGAVLVFRDVTEAYRAKAALRERVKELTCLQQIREAVHGDASVDQACRSIVSYLARGMQFPEIAVPVITVGRQRFAGQGWMEGLTHGLHADIEVAGEVSGCLSLFYTQDEPFILPEEQNLIDATARILSHFVERKRAEEVLFCSEIKFRTLYDSTGDAIMLLDDKGFFACNRATLSIFGCATEEVFCSKHPADLSPAEQPDGRDSMTLANEKIETAIREGSSRFEWIHKRDDTGEEFPAEVLLSAMELDGRQVLQAAVRDITERKQAERRLKETFAELERFNRLMTGREMRVIEMKKEVNALLAALGREPQYQSVRADAPKEAS